MKKYKPLIAVTMGDPAGIGPEIIVGAWTETVVHEWCRPVVVGHPEIMRRAVALWQTGLEVVEVDGIEDLLREKRQKTARAMTQVGGEGIRLLDLGR